MALLRVDNGMSEETDEVVCHDNKGVAGFGSLVKGRRGVRNLCALISANVTSLAIFTTNARNGIGEPYTDPGR
jgi:hypothetical protein